MSVYNDNDNEACSALHPALPNNSSRRGGGMALDKHITHKYNRLYLGEGAGGGGRRGNSNIFTHIYNLSCIHITMQ